MSDLLDEAHEFLLCMDKMEYADALFALRAELTAKEKALSSAKIALDAKDRAYSVIDQRFSAMAAKAATTDSERECNERLTAEIDALTAELTEARRQLAAQPAVPEAVAKDAARYRWLRDQHNRHLGLTICKVNTFDLEPWSGDDPDTAIDAAILSATDSEVKK